MHGTYMSPENNGLVRHAWIVRCAEIELMTFSRTLRITPDGISDPPYEWPDRVHDKVSQLSRGGRSKNSIVSVWSNLSRPHSLIPGSWPEKIVSTDVVPSEIGDDVTG